MPLIVSHRFLSYYFTQNTDLMKISFNENFFGLLFSDTTHKKDLHSQILQKIDFAYEESEAFIRGVLMGHISLWFNWSLYLTLLYIIWFAYSKKSKKFNMSYSICRSNIYRQTTFLGFKYKQKIFMGRHIGMSHGAAQYNTLQTIQRHVILSFLYDKKYKYTPWFFYCSIYKHVYYKSR